MKILIIAAFLVLVVMGFGQPVYWVDQAEQGIVTQLGVYVKTIKEPGLQFKVPFLQAFHSYDKRVLISDAPPTEYLTTDKKRLVVDSYSRWRISDPLLFYKTVRTDAGARARLDGFILSELRREMASHNLKEITGPERERIMETVAQRGGELVADFGIEIIDVRIRRADLPPEVQNSVFDRMVAERQRIAKRYRAEGEEEARKIKAEADKQVTIISAEADRQSKEIRGDGDAEATRIYAEVYGQDPEFYAFMRSLEAYEKLVGADSTFILDADSDLFRYMSGSGTQTQAGPP